MTDSASRGPSAVAEFLVIDKYQLSQMQYKVEQLMGISTDPVGFLYEWERITICSGMKKKWKY